MESMDLTVLYNKLTLTPPTQEELKTIAHETTQNILVKINECSKSIADAKGAAEDARDKKIGMFGAGSKKKINATSEALVQTNKAIAEMNNVVQESIKFTCVSYIFAEIMRDTLQIMISQGFTNYSGELIRLNENGKEAALLVLQETEYFAQRQKEQEMNIVGLKGSVEENKESIAANAERIDEHNQLHEHARLSRQRIHIKNEEQDKLLEHARLSRQRIHIKNEEQDKLIEKANQEIEILSIKIETLEKIANKGSLITIFSIAAVALIIAGVSLIIHFLA